MYDSDSELSEISVEEFNKRNKGQGQKRRGGNINNVEQVSKKR